MNEQPFEQAGELSVGETLWIFNRLQTLNPELLEALAVALSYAAVQKRSKELHDKIRAIGRHDKK